MPQPTVEHQSLPVLRLSLSPAITSIDLSNLVDAKGVVQEVIAIELSSPNGVGEITIPQGVTALNADGTPLGKLEVQYVKQPPARSSHCQIIGLAYHLGPEGATFAPAITLTLNYDPALCPEAVSADNIAVAYFDFDTGQWVKLESTVDTVNHVATAEIKHLSVFAVLAGAAPGAPSVQSVSWSLTGGIIGGMAILALLLYVPLRRRRTGDREWRWNGAAWVPSHKKSNKEWHWNGTDWVPPKK
jgi:hypothetical protein